MEKRGEITKELKEHVPFTALATAIAIILIAITFNYSINLSETMFEILHPAHIIFSAFVTTAIFYKYKKNILLALLIGIIGSIAIGSISDIILPWLEANLLGLSTHFHLPVIENTLVILSAAYIGSLAGIWSKTTKLSHSLHVFISVFASLFYIIAFSQFFNMAYLLLAFIIVFIAVIIPCCLSDIVFPLLFIKKK